MPRLPGSNARSALLKAGPEPPSSTVQHEPGLRWLDVKSVRKPALFVPGEVAAGCAMPLVVLLHGAGGDATGILPLLQEQAERHGFLVLAPQSAGRTWDLVLGGYGPDVEALEKALLAVFSTYPVDPAHIAIAGFSDGASYALSVGLDNAALFSHILAFSPGFMGPLEPAGRPRIFITHGMQDSVLPIDRCSRTIAPRLSAAGYEVDYREFEGGHVVPPAFVSASIDSWLG